MFVLFWQVFFYYSDIQGWIHEVNILLVQFLSQQLHGFAEALEVDDFPLPQELDDIVHIRVVTQAKDVIIGYASLLLCCIFK